MDEKTRAVYDTIMARWYADGAEVSLRRISERMAELLAACEALLNACYAADVNEELPEQVDGSLLDAACAALAKARDESGERCARCNQPLNNVSPGYSIVSGGRAVCADCLKPGEEVLRARSI